jgi:hypothetical protein
MKVLVGSDDEQGTYSNGEQPGAEGLPTALAELCDIDEESTNENNKYHYALRYLYLSRTTRTIANSSCLGY